MTQAAGRVRNDVPAQAAAIPFASGQNEHVTQHR
jgi:hypothetical protein